MSFVSTLFAIVVLQCQICNVNCLKIAKLENLKIEIEKKNLTQNLKLNSEFGTDKFHVHSTSWNAKHLCWHGQASHLCWWRLSAILMFLNIYRLVKGGQSLSQFFKPLMRCLCHSLSKIPPHVDSKQWVVCCMIWGTVEFADNQRAEVIENFAFHS